MPVDNPEVNTIVVSTAGGLFGGGIVALSKPMSRREVCFCLLGGTGIGAFLPPALVAYFGLQWFIAGAIGFVGGISVMGLVPLLQSASNRWVKDNLDRLTGTKNDPHANPERGP
jgi:hypothetical protein